ncbi:MAG: NADH dehydrogenase [Omnitrophica bacterium GWA2_52_8]|nr:MAG: NADH dehydrogenase [Omnitrophica bacterium GWA2_52_8]
MTGIHIKLQEKFGAAVREIHNQHGDETAVADRSAFLTIVQFVRNNHNIDCDMLTDITAVDGLSLKWKPRFEVIYHFYSTKKNHRLRLKVKVDEQDPVVPSLAAEWGVANWLEREVWDMFGIRFEGHPDLRRILMYEQFSGHPLRKDYPYSKRQPLIGPKN